MPTNVTLNTYLVPSVGLIDYKIDIDLLESYRSIGKIYRIIISSSEI